MTAHCCGVAAVLMPDIMVAGRNNRRNADKPKFRRVQAGDAEMNSCMVVVEREISLTVKTSELDLRAVLLAVLRLQS